MEENYKNREIDSMFKTLEEKMSEKHQDVMLAFDKMDEKQDTVISQQKYTNGKVMKHEIWMKAFWWFFGFIGALVVFSVPLFKYVILTEIHKTSEKAVQESLNEELEPAITAALESMFSKVEVVE